ncbi:MAG: carbamoyltransferase HypF [Planctomycetota bacterium]
MRGRPEVAAAPIARRWHVGGDVQGVGFRPWVYRLASRLALRGWVANTSSGACLEVSGSTEALAELEAALRSPPRPIRIRSLSCERITADVPDAAFRIRDSLAPSVAAPCLPLADRRVCEDCLREVFDRSNRRFRYPFTTCTGCGPRYSIAHRSPFDRVHTAMAVFELCADCVAEYRTPTDRRFHAQTIACPRCGPRLTYRPASIDARLDFGEDALLASVRLLQEGGVLALAGLGGYQLLVRADDSVAVERLRRRKQRPRKPLAVLFADRAQLEGHVVLDVPTYSALASPAGPIVLCEKRGGTLAPSLAPDDWRLGALLPTTPLHAILAADLEAPIVATSGNRSGEPLCRTEDEARERLAGIADAFLSHDREIVRRLDDSVVQIVSGRPRVLRLARGYAPLALELVNPVPAALAVGGHLKCAVAIAEGHRVVLGSHIGDLDSAESCQALDDETRDLSALTRIRPSRIGHDLHPDYASTRWAEGRGEPRLAVSHHEAHVRAVLVEHRLEEPVLAFAWDGAGVGPDGTVWGGEVFQSGGRDFRRWAHLQPFPLPGGDRAARDPWRAALGLGWAVWGEEAFEACPPLAGAFEAHERRLLWRALARGIGAPSTTSVGRLFDGVAALLGEGTLADHEGEVPRRVERLARAARGEPAPYPFLIREESGLLVIDWRPMIREIAASKEAPAERALRFHHTLVAWLVALARRAAMRHVVLSGGCFQNALLLSEGESALRAAGHRVVAPERVPPGDGSLALGQIHAQGA